MPERNGWDVLEMARRIQDPPRVLILTAYGKEDTRRLAKEKGLGLCRETLYHRSDQGILKEGNPLFSKKQGDGF